MNKLNKNLSQSLITTPCTLHTTCTVIVLSKYMKEAFSAVAKFGPSYKLPSRAAMSGPLLDLAVADTETKTNRVQSSKSVTGATIVKLT